MDKPKKEIKTKEKDIKIDNEEVNNKITEEDDTMNATVARQGYKRLDFSKLNFSDKVVTAEEALRDVIPFKWSEDVLHGKKEVIIKKAEDK